MDNKRFSFSVREKDEILASIIKFFFEMTIWLLKLSFIAEPKLRIKRKKRNVPAASNQMKDSESRRSAHMEDSARQAF